MEPMRRSSFFLLVVLAWPLAALAAPGDPVRVFSCEANGRTVYGDKLPPECYGRAWVQKINGITVYRESAQPTPEESARRKELERIKKAEDEEALKKKRQDDALLERYPSLADLDTRRDRETREIDDVIAELRVHEKELVARRKNFDEEVKALKDKGKPIPDDLTKVIRYADEELAARRAVIERKIRERDELRKTFDDDRRRYIEVTTSAPPLPAKPAK
jgi:hypothetical protein